MSSTTDLIAERLPRVTEDDVHRFSDSVDIRDAPAFAAELQAFIHECLKAARLSATSENTSLAQSLARKAVALRAGKRWSPADTDIQRGRAILLEAFNRPQNLTPPAFATLADKSRQQIYKDIRARRLLALSVGPRGQKLPDWQLDPVKQQLTQAVLQKTEGIDSWTVYRALSDPLESLGGHSPVDAVTNSSIEDITLTVLNVLGVQAH